MRKTKILFICGSLGVGGKERQLTYIISGLPEDRFELSLVLRTDYIYRNREKILSKLKHYEVIGNGKESWGKKSFIDVLRIIKKIHPDIVHSWVQPISFTLAILKKTYLLNNNIRLIDGSLRATDYNKYHNRFFIIQNFINRNADLVISNNKTCIKEFTFKKNIPRVIYNGLEKSSPCRYSSIVQVDAKLNNNNIIIAMVSRFVERKHFGEYLQVAKDLISRRQDIQFLCMGDGELLEYYKDKYTKEVAENKIFFLGRRDDVPDILAFTDIGVLVSTNEGISNSLMEYMQSSLPVVASNSGGNPELVIDQETGFLIPLHDTKALSEKLNILIDNPVLRQKLGEKGHNRINDFFSIDLLIANYIEVYNNLM